MAAAALVLACLSVAAVKPQLAHAGSGCGTWVKVGQWFGCGAEQGEWTLIAGGIAAGGGNHHDCVDQFGISGGKDYWPYEWRCGTGSIYGEFPKGGGALIPAFYNTGSAEVDGYVNGI
jgi:hypothetical protein